MNRIGTGRNARWAAAIPAAAALALFWSVVWGDLDGTVLTRVPVLDEAHYLREADAIAGGRLLPDGPFLMSPLYPYLVAATGSGRDIGADQLRVGPPPRGIRILQAVLWLGTAVLLWRCARRYAPPRFACLAPALWLLYSPGAVFVTSVLLEVPLAFLAAAALAVATGGGGAPSRRRALTAGLLVGCAALLRAHAALLILPVALALARGTGTAEPTERAWRRAAPAALALVLMLLPPVLHNSLQVGRPVGPSLNGGLNLYIGNGPAANGFFLSLRGYDMRTDPIGRRLLAEKLRTEVPDAAAADRAWAAEAWRCVAADPGRAAGLWLKKVWLHGVAVEFSQVSQLDSWSREAPLLRILAAPYGLLSAGGLLGLVLVGWRDRRLRPWALALVLLVVTQSAFFVVTRYRLVLVPLLALLAALAAAELSRWTGRRRLVGAALVGAAVLAVWPWGLGGRMSRLRAAGLLNEGVRWELLAAVEPAAREKAASLYVAASELDPVLPEPYRALARLYRRTDRVGEALAVLRTGLARAEPAGEVRRDLVRLLLESGFADEALPLLEAQLRDRPDDPDTLHNLAVTLSTTGRIGEAEEVAADLVRIAPDDPRSYLDLGVILARQRRYAEARDAFRAGLRRHPQDARLRTNLEHVESLLAE
jgi:Flp pilus assembly protein TadD